MKPEVDFYAFVERTNQAGSIEELYHLLEGALREIGYDRFVYSFLTDHPSIGKAAGYGELRNYPDDWFQYYMEQGYCHTDPAVKFGRLYREPVQWAELASLHPLSGEEKRILNEGAEAGLLDGIAVPLHGPGGELAGFGMASSSGGVEMHRNRRSMIAAIAQQFHLVYCELCKKSESEESSPRLTRREQEVLQWCAAGKSNWEIGQLLSISQHGVEFHFRNIFRKLGVNSRVTAVVKAIRYGLIDCI